MVTGLTLLALDATGFAPIGGVRRSVLAAAGPVQGLVGAAAAPVAGLWNGVVHYDEVVDENHRLRRRLAAAEGQLAAQPDLRAELASLADAVDIDLLDDVDRVTARVVADRRGPIEQLVELDRGSDDGIAPGMPVVTGAGLVGTIDEVVDTRSVVRLIVDSDSAVGVRSSNGIGLVVGRPGGRLELRPGPDLGQAIERGQVGAGQRLLTSGLEHSRFPAGLPVAVLAPADIEAGDGSVGGAIAARPTADLAQLGYLTVLLVDRPA